MGEIDMRSVKEAGTAFNFKNPIHCYFSVDSNGVVTQLPHKNKGDRPELWRAISAAKEGKITIYCTWAGRYSTDLFIVDDLDSMLKEFI